MAHEHAPLDEFKDEYRKRIRDALNRFRRELEQIASKANTETYGASQFGPQIDTNDVFDMSVSNPVFNFMLAQCPAATKEDHKLKWVRPPDDFEFSPRLFEIVYPAIKAAGTYDPSFVIPHFSMRVTETELRVLATFLSWCDRRDMSFAADNYRLRFEQWRAIWQYTEKAPAKHVQSFKMTHNCHYLSRVYYRGSVTKRLYCVVPSDQSKAFDFYECNRDGEPRWPCEFPLRHRFDQLIFPD